jgi:DNA-binding transcriptional MerR regulator
VTSQLDATEHTVFQIGEVAERAGLSLRTVRYYEEVGLIVPAKRTDGGFRLYTTDHVARLELIKEMKLLGFTVPQTCELLEARDALRARPADAASRERVASFAQLAAQRCDELRAHLHRAEAFTSVLRREGGGSFDVPDAPAS